MLLIRSGQYDHLRARQRSRFVHAVQLRLNELFPEKIATVGEERLKHSIDAMIEWLKPYNIVRERDVERFLYLMFTFSFDITRDPKFLWVQEILFDNSLPGHVKLDLLYQRGNDFLNGGQ